MGMELTDYFTFGKYKGKTVEFVYKDNPGYLLWMRDAKADPRPDEEYSKQEPNRQFFDLSVLQLLNETLDLDKGLARKHRKWDLDEFAADATQKVEARRADDYQEQWGAF